MNNHEFSGLKQIPLISSQLCRSPGTSWRGAQLRFSQGWNQALSQLHLWWISRFLPSSCCCSRVQFPEAVALKSLFPCWEMVSATRGCSYSLPCGPLMFKANSGESFSGSILLMLQISQTLNPSLQEEPHSFSIHSWSDWVRSRIISLLKIQLCHVT